MMRILHLADIHAGKTLHGLDRTPEIERVLDQICRIAHEREVDFVLIAGDLFDTPNPSAAAQRAIHNFLVALSRLKIRVIGIGGNHDSLERIDALNVLADAHEADLLGRPKPAGRGGRIDRMLGRQKLSVYRLPFISQRQTVDLLEEDRFGQYSERMNRLIGALTQDYDPDAINVFMAHGTVDGSTLSGSEYRFHSGVDYAFDLTMVPGSFAYTALGHIHKAQWVVADARYSGSLIQLDFGERRERKSVTIVELEPGRIVDSEVIELDHRWLYEEAIDADELDEPDTLYDLREITEENYLKLVIQATNGTAGLREKARSLIPDALVIQVLNTTDPAEALTEIDRERHLSLEESYARYANPSEAEAKAFRELLEGEETRHETD